ncbi:response regulator [Candidatus Nitronereus thalassa]|uniref:Response regulator n=1 Tax=Candidatus Nitronereus thalassa TaxID=3020898 RepID=A0ABU3KAX5_9BACT|nr:response regulator [Candidatus Nitronereus thalassa]MDT7043581.1 response regulator [Candidatus Nitronereus thalassa]
MKEGHPPILSQTQNQILLLSEDQEFVYALGDDLNGMGLQVTVESGSKFGKEPSKSLPYDGIILDLDVKEESHLHVFHNLYAQNRQIPIVVVGTEKMHFDFLFALIGGARDFLVKPVDSARLKWLCVRLFL